MLKNFFDDPYIKNFFLDYPPTLEDNCKRVKIESGRKK